MELEIKNNPAGHRFEVSLGDKTAFLAYKLRPGVMTVLHTEVPPELEGRGIAATLSRYALGYIAAEKLQLVPLCPYLKDYLQKHPEYQYLVKT